MTVQPGGDASATVDLTTSAIKPRQLRPGQRCLVWIADAETGEAQRVLETTSVLLEAPNWLGDDRLLLNGDGRLWTLTLAGDLDEVPLTGVPDLNNDHVPDVDGEHVYLSANDGSIYRAPLAGGAGELVTRAAPSEQLWHFLHGVSPDGGHLAFIGLETGKTMVGTVITITSAGTDYRRLTSGQAPADGCEYSPDGSWIYFNTEQFDGHAQIARMRPDGSGVEQLTDDEQVNWFPHLSPDGARAAYLAFPPGTAGHPADLPVEIKVVDLPRWHAARTLARIPGGQGTLNVNSWAPDSRRLAFVTYPLP